jgi:hypothetical protein
MKVTLFAASAAMVLASVAPSDSLEVAGVDPFVAEFDPFPKSPRSDVDVGDGREVAPDRASRVGDGELAAAVEQTAVVRVRPERRKFSEEGQIPRIPNGDRTLLAVQVGLGRIEQRAVG